MSKTLTPSTEGNRIYEFSILYPLSLSQKEEQTLIKEINTIFEEAKATLVDQDEWRDVGLAYRIKKHDRGRFVIRYYEMSPTAVKQADDALRILPNLLRHLVVKPPEGEEIVKYSERFAEWLQWRKKQSENKETEQEEKLKQQIIKKAARKEASPVPKKPKEDADSGVALEGKLEELISDEDLHL